MENKTPAQVAIGLVHWPVVDRAGTTVATNITNIDIYDIARVARTYGVDRYFLINRLREQLMFATRIKSHWTLGRGAKYHPSRKIALSHVELAEELQDALARWKKNALVVATSAKPSSELENIDFKQLRDEIFQQPDRPVFLVFGTGNGLESSIYEHCDRVLEPIQGAQSNDFRHLSVRSAVSICLDRLLGSW